MKKTMKHSETWDDLPTEEFFGEFWRSLSFWKRVEYCGAETALFQTFLPRVRVYLELDAFAKSLRDVNFFDV